MTENQTMKRDYEKPQLISHGNLKQITGGTPVSDVPALSDQRLKKNVCRLESRAALETLLQLEGVMYEWIHPEEHQGDSTTSIMAQNLQSVFPQWVKSIEPRGRDKELIPEGEKALALSFPVDFNAYLIESIRAQQDQIEAQQTQISELKVALEELKAALESGDPSAPTAKLRLAAQ